MEEIRWRANLRGIDIDKAIAKETKKKGYMFSDPKDYKKMTDEEREIKTNEMLSDHKMMFNLPGGK